MELFRRIVLVAALAGLAAGLAMTALQQVGTVPLILQAETYEAKDHPADHQHEQAWEPADGAERLAFTAAANVLSAIGFALLLVAAGELRGGIATWREGVLWGLAGFAIFTLAPSLGLPPELPAMPAAPLGARQAWWLATVVTTAGGLALLAFRRGLPWVALAAVLLVAPHLIGAPQPASHESPVPAALARQFVAAVVSTSLVFWILLGGLAGFVRTRLATR